MKKLAEISIRRAVQGDLSAILRIEKTSFGCDAWTRDSFLAYLARPDRCVFLVSLVDGKVTGYVIGFRTGPRASVDSLAVRPAQRRLGIALALMSRLKQALKRRGCTTLSLAVRLDNAAAIGLYTRLGFRRERRINDYYEDGAPAWWMRVSLESSIH